MKKHIFIQANNKQLIGAKIAQFAIETKGKAKELKIPITIINVEDVPVYMQFAGISYRRGKEMRVLDPHDLQFFTLSRFMPPELMGYNGRALVIDPDIFALSDIQELFEMDLEGNAVAACPKKDAWDSSVMVLECSQLKHWNIERILSGLQNQTEDYQDWVQIKREPVLALSRIWNSLDELTEETKMLHTTQRLTQPWRTGLPVDFSFGTVPKLFKFIPRFWIKHPTHYLPHPNRDIEGLFFSIAREAYQNKFITQSEIQKAISEKNVRSDFLAILENE